MNTAIILAGGRSSRMKTGTNKVLEPVCGKPIINYTVEQLKAADIGQIIIVVGFCAERVKHAVGDVAEFVFQPTPQGTGHAVMCALPYVNEFTQNVLIMNGDGPMVDSGMIDKILTREPGVALNLLTIEPENPGGLGRILRASDGSVTRVIESKDASPAEKEIRECNAGLYCFDAELLRKYIKKLNPHNAQHEYYITQLIELFCEANLRINAVKSDDACYALSVNTLEELSEVEGFFRSKINCALMQSGVRFIDINSAYIDMDAVVKSGAVIYPNVYIRGKSVVNESCVLLPGAFIQDSVIEARVQLGPCVVINSTITSKQRVEPFGVYLNSQKVN